MTQLPTRSLGRTGVDVSVLALGGVKYNFLEDRDAAAVVHRALDLGINYIDTAYGYQDSERKIGLATSERRDEVFLATKTGKRDRDGAGPEIEESLRRFQTDHIDCLQIHWVDNEEDLKAILAPNGVVKLLEELRTTETIRFIGVTGHRADMVARALREYSFDTVLTPMGAMHGAVRPFFDTVLDAARENGTAVLAMKVMAYGFLEEHREHALRYVLGLPGVSAAVVGVDTIEQLEQHVEVAAAFQPLSEEDRTKLLGAARGIYEAQKQECWFIPPLEG